MIPRTKVNYSLVELARAALVRSSDGRHTQQMLQGLSQFLGTDQLLAAPSGRGALYFILKASDRPVVVVPAYTCKAVVEAAQLAGKQVRYVGVEAGGFNLEPAQLASVADEQCIVIATHQFGIPCDIERVLQVCAQRGALVVEDAAAALGSTVGDRPVGTFGQVGFFSFDSTKLLTVPMKGGLIVARDPAWLARIEGQMRAELQPMPSAHKLRLLAQAAALVLLENHLLYRAFHTLMFERKGRYTTDGPGLDVRASEFYRYGFAEWQAFLAVGQVRRLQELVSGRRRLYERLREALGGCRTFELPPAETAGRWACIRFPLRVKGDKLAFYRRGVRRGIDFAFSFTFLAAPGSDPRSDELAAAVLDIPYYSRLSDREFDQVVEALCSMDREASGEGP
jgi:dTDP-4-amino-4,6-dideoxygalactose transaminase